jgi:transcriptional regulator with XRE-family HTH domain
MSTLKDRLRRIREELGLSQSELAARCGLSIDSIQNWEQGRTQPRLPALMQLAACLGVSLDTLVTGPKRRPGRPRAK